MNPALQSMLSQHAPRTVADHVRALREVQQAIALLGLWRAKFFEHAAFYGGTALRMLYGLDRYSEDMDFSLLGPDAGFRLCEYAQSACRELEAYGFSVTLDEVRTNRPIHSAFIKGETVRHLLTIAAGEDWRRRDPAGPFRISENQ